MNKDDLRTGISRSWEILRCMSLDETFSNPVSMVASEEFLELVFSRNDNYETIYLSGLKNTDYNMMLRDISYLQFSIGDDDHVRYAYYPNPFLGSSESSIRELDELRLYVQEEAISIEDYLAKVGELRNSQHAPLLRYENAPNQYREFNHPCSHFHIGHHDNNRWPIQRILTPAAFTMLVVRQFYPDYWFALTSMKCFGKVQTPDHFLMDEKLNCRILANHHFSPTEARLFVFS